MEIEILYEDKDYLIIDKPSGLMVHSDGRSNEQTLVDWVLENYPEMESVGEKFRGGLVHRLDRETSGVLALAKNQKAFEHLKNQFQERKIQKVYKAFVYGIVKEDREVIDRPIGRSQKFGLWSAQRGTRGKEREAITEYKVLRRGGGYSFLELQPKTGRTHQIRVHLKAINYPVVCDKLYASKSECALGFERLALHAESLEFEGLNGNKIKVISPLPGDFIEAQEQLKNVAE